MQTARSCRRRSPAARWAWAASVLAGCAAPRPTLDQQADRFLHERRERMAVAAAAFAARADFPRVQHSGAGTLTLQRGELMGPIGHEFVRVRFVYRNDTETTYDRIRLRFAVVDAQGRVRGRENLDLLMPLDYRFTPGNTYTDEVDVPTGGAHATPGFDLAVEIAGETW
jgi:hypothetical protein